MAWDIRADFASIEVGDNSTSMSTAGFIDARAIANDGTSLTCSTSCTFTVGAEVQTLDVYSGDTNPLSGGEYRLGYTTGSVEEGNQATATSADCIDFDAASGVVQTAVESITGSSVLVTREAITDPGPGYRYWITFAGAAVIGNVQELEVSDSSGAPCDPWTVGSGVATTQHQISVATEVNLKHTEPLVRVN